jgi:hypothetical protein
MIRLSCWIGGVGYVLGDKAVVEHRDQSQSLVMQISTARRCIDADIDSSRCAEWLRFENVASRLARHFNLVDTEEDGESSLNEIGEAWRKCREKLIAHSLHEPLRGSGETVKFEKGKSPCSSDVCC